MDNVELGKAYVEYVLSRESLKHAAIVTEKTKQGFETGKVKLNRNDPVIKRLMELDSRIKSLYTPKITEITVGEIVEWCIKNNKSLLAQLWK